MLLKDCTEMNSAGPERSLIVSVEARQMYILAIFGIGVLAVLAIGSVAAAVMLFPDFLQYLKMRSL